MPKARTTNLVGSLVLAVGDAIWRSTRQAIHLTGESVAALVTIGNNPGNSVDWLSRALALSHSGAVRIVDRLARAGMVTRRALPGDARGVALFLTARGKRKMHEALQYRRAILTQVLSVLSPAEQDTLCELAERILAGVTTEELADSMCRLCEERVCPQSTCPVTLACERAGNGRARTRAVPRR